MEIRDAVRRLLPAPLRRQRPVRRSSEIKVLLDDYYATLSSNHWAGTYRARPWPVERAVSEAYERLVWVHKAVEAIAGHSSRLPFLLKDGDEDVEEHPLYRVLNGRANPLETGQQLRKRLAQQVLLSKRGAFIQVTKSRGGDITRMDLLPPGRTQPVPASGARAKDLISHFEVLKSDGSIIELGVEEVRWFRDPHPLDAFSGVTPLEAAGMSAELDFFTRLYNIQFLKNDSRPGGVLAIDGELEPSEMDRIESKFGRGAHEAGKLTVITGQVTYTDLAARPRDMAYEVTSRIAKTEILTAFGVPESVIGDASQRTWDNAEQEFWNFWSITMPPFLTLLAQGFDDDTADDLVTGWDFSGVEVLQRGEIARREEARREFELGLISIDEYRELCGREPFAIPRSRALYLPSGKTVVATSEADQKALDEEAAAKVPAELAANLANPPDGRQLGGPQRGRPPIPSTQPAQAPPQQVNERPNSRDRVPASKAAKPVLRLIRGADQVFSRVQESVPDEQARDRLEGAVAAAVAALWVRLAGRTQARLISPKVRKGTRHWQARHDVDTGVGSKQLDVVRAVDEARWEEETTATVEPLVQAAVAAAAAALVADLASPGESPLDGVAGNAATSVVSAIVGLAGGAARRTAARLREELTELEARGEVLGVLENAVRLHSARLPTWAEALAVQVATGAIGGAREAAAEALARDGGFVAERTWHTRGDELVRNSHLEAEGQTQPAGTPFEVGYTSLRFPGDPQGPAEEVARCRCWLTYQVQSLPLAPRLAS